MRGVDGFGFGYEDHDLGSLRYKVELGVVRVDGVVDCWGCTRLWLMVYSVLQDVLPDRVSQLDVVDNRGTHVLVVVEVSVHEISLGCGISASDACVRMSFLSRHGACCMYNARHP